MAGNIKGITIEFRGDATPLQKALRVVDSEAYKAAQELKSINTALKFNPRNVELLKQKQQQLAQRITATKDKVDALRQAQEQMDEAKVDKTSAEYQKITRQIIEANSQLKAFEAEQRKVAAQASKLGQFSARMQSVGQSLTSAGQAMRGFSMAGAAVVGTLGTISYKASTAADDLNTMSKKYSISTRDLQEYSLAAKQVDVDVDAIAKSHVKLEKNMLSAAQGSKNQAAAFEALGVEYKNADGSLRDGGQVWQEVIKALGQMENETERDAYAMRLMGRSAAELNPLIEDNGETFERMARLYSKYDLDFVDQATLDKANEFRDDIDDIRSIGQLAFMTLGSRLAGYLEPALEKVVDLVGRFANWASKLNPRVLAVAGGIAAIVAATAPLLIGLGRLAFAISSITALMAKWQVANAAGVGVFSKLLGVVGATGPWGVAALAIAGTALALKGLYDSAHQYTQAAAEMEESHQKQIASLTGTSNQLTWYADRLDQLVAKEEKSASDKELIKTYVDQLNSSIDGLNLAYDEETNKLNQSAEAIRGKIDAMEAEMVAEAYRQQAQEITNEMVANELELQEKRKELAEKQAQAQNAQLGYAGKYETEAAAIQRSINDLEAANSDYEDQLNNVMTAQERMATISGPQFQQIAAQARAAGVNVDQAINDMEAGLIGVPNSVYEMVLAADPAFNELVTTATNAGITIPQSLIDGINNGSVNVDAATLQLRQLVEGQLGQTNTAPDGKRVATGYAGGMTSAEAQAQVKTASASLVSTAKSGTSASSSNGSTAGGEFTSGYAAGMTSSTSLMKVALAGAQVAAKAKASVQQAQNSGSPSKVAMALGSDFGEGYAIGLQQEVGAVARAASFLTGAAFSGVDTGSVIGGLNNTANAATALRSVPQNNLNTQLNGVADSIVNGLGALQGIGQTTAPINITLYAFPSGPKMEEWVVNTYDTGKRKQG